MSYLPEKATTLSTDVGMAKREVRRVVRAERGAERRHAARALRPRPHERDDLVVEVVVVLVVPADPLGRMPVLRVEALGIDAVHAGELNRTLLDEVADRADQAEVLVLVEAPADVGNQIIGRPAWPNHSISILRPRWANPRRCIRGSWLQFPFEAWRSRGMIARSAPGRQGRFARGSGGQCHLPKDTKPGRPTCVSEGGRGPCALCFRTSVTGFGLCARPRASR